MKSLDNLVSFELEETWQKVQRYQAMRKERDRVARDHMARQARKFLGEKQVENVYHFLSRKFEEESPIEFYNALFRDYLDIPGEFNKGAYVAIVTEKEELENDEYKIYRYSVTDGLAELQSLIQSSDNFCFMSPISYCGKRATQNNARYLFGFVIDLDSIVYKDDVPIGLYNLVFQLMNEVLPRPSYLVSSGSGVHLYYIFNEPIPLYRNNVRLLKSVRKKLIKQIWNPYVTENYSDKKIQWESLWQGFRVVGTKTKKGNICRAFRVGNAETVSLEYICSFLYDDEKEFIKNFKFMHKYSYEELKKMWPDWTERHLDKNGKPLKNPTKKYWTCKPELYFWYLNRLEKEIEPGHRYHSLMCLAGYALKSGISYEQFEKDCWNLFEAYENKSYEEDNHWKISDVKSALACYKNGKLRELSIEAIVSYTGLPIERNKRNGHSQKVHLEIARSTKKIIKESEGLIEGRPSKKFVVENWKKDHPNGTKADCIRDTGLSKPTVYKWWSGEDVKVIQKPPKDDQKQNATAQINYDEMVQEFIKYLLQGASAADIASKVADPNADDKERVAVQSFVEATQRTIKNILDQNEKIEDDQKKDKKIENATNSTEII